MVVPAKKAAGGLTAPPGDPGKLSPVSNRQCTEGSGKHCPLCAAQLYFSQAGGISTPRIRTVEFVPSFIALHLFCF